MTVTPSINPSILDTETGINNQIARYRKPSFTKCVFFAHIVTTIGYTSNDKQHLGRDLLHLLLPLVPKCINQRIAMITLTVWSIISLNVQ